MLNKITLGCHGIRERCFKFRGKHLPFCARCLGASVGHVSAAANFFAAPMLPLLFAPFGLSIMLCDWLLQNKYQLYHSNIARLITGIVAGYSVGQVIWYIVKAIVAKI